MNTPLATTLRTAIEPYDRRSLAECVGALHLVPANGDRRRRLDAFGDLARRADRRDV
jgi:hypothetical protein